MYFRQLEKYVKNLPMILTVLWNRKLRTLKSKNKSNSFDFNARNVLYVLSIATKLALPYRPTVGEGQIAKVTAADCTETADSR